MNDRNSWDTWNIVAGACVGAGLMYLLDPQGGNRRRALMRDKMIWAMRKSRDAAGATARDLGHRAIGATAELRASMRPEEEVDNDVLVERVRAELGRLTSHPSSIEVKASDGQITLSGPILAHEVDRVMCGIQGVRGVRSVENRLTSHKSAGDVPGLQGGAARPGRRFPWMQNSWSPTARLFVTTAGAAMTLYGLRQRHPLGIAMAAAGIGLFTRGITDVGPGRLVGIHGTHEAIERPAPERIGAAQSMPRPTVVPRRTSRKDPFGGLVH